MELLLVVLISFFGRDEQHIYVSTEIENRWIFTPASGEVEGYIIQKSNDYGNTWSVIEENLSSEINENGFIEFIHTSTESETYFLRIIAFDAAGNQGPTSEISEPLSVILAPGKPKHIE